MKQMGDSATPGAKQMAQEMYDCCRRDIEHLARFKGAVPAGFIEDGIFEKILGYAKKNRVYVSADTGLHYVVENVRYDKGAFTVSYRGRSGAHKGAVFFLSLIDFLAIRPDGSPAFSLLPGDD